jgi:uncharacterized membrane protein (Fun14 family)
MSNTLTYKSGGPLRSIAALRGGRSPFTAKSVLSAIGLFIASAIAWLSDPAKGSVLSVLQPHAPAIMSAAGSYLGGYFIGWGARRTLKLTSIIAGIALAVIGLLAFWGWGGSGAEAWVNSSVTWVGESIRGAGRYLAAGLPSAAAAAVGGVLGFRRK